MLKIKILSKNTNKIKIYKYIYFILLPIVWFNYIFINIIKYNL